MATIDLGVVRGKNGVSPTITVTDIAGGHRVTIVDVNGSKSFDVMDGGGTPEITVDQDLNTTSDVTFKSVTANVVYGAVFME